MWRKVAPLLAREFTVVCADGRIKVLRTTKGSGGGAPGRVLDDTLTVACGEGAIRLLELQRAGRQPMRAEEFLRGTAMPAGSVLG